MNIKDEFEEKQPLSARFYAGLIGAVFLISSTIVLGLSIRIIRILTAIEEMREIRHIFYSALFFPGLGVLLVLIYPKFKKATTKTKHLMLLASLLLLISVSILMGYLSGPTNK